MAYDGATLSHTRQSILKDIVVERGPIDVLGPYFLHVELETRRRGVALEFCTPEQLLAANVDNRKSWLPLVPMFNPKFGLIRQDNAFCVLGRNLKGEVVTANAILRYDWEATDFVDEATSLRLFYADPEKMRLPGEQCIITSSRARCIHGSTAFSGAAWVRQDYRRRGLSELLPRFIKAYAAARWQLDVIFGMMAEAVERLGVARQFGYEEIDWEARWLNSIAGTLRLAILWADVAYLADDLRAVLARAAAQVDARVLERNT
jgi:GNAT superfamily N-acetyltransferase